jgi:hypothetical protein
MYLKERYVEYWIFSNDIMIKFFNQKQQLIQKSADSKIKRNVSYGISAMKLLALDFPEAIEISKIQHFIKSKETYNLEIVIMISLSLHVPETMK